MNFVKLQLGCFVIVVYILFCYVKETIKKKDEECNPYFDVLLAIVPWAIFFDGATAWTVNHQEIVPAWVNLTLHGLFYVSIELVVMFALLYFLDQTIHIKYYKKMTFLLLTPGIIGLILILVFLPKVYYIHGETTWYSMGLSPIITYISIAVQFVIIFLLLANKYKYMNKRTVQNLIIFLTFAFICLISQVVFPEILISAMFPTLLVLGFYLNIEDPSLRRIIKFSDSMVMNFATLVENKDNNTGGHIMRTQKYVEIISNEMTKNPAYIKNISKDYQKNIIAAAPLHDLGKIGIPDHILQKPGKLTDEEFNIMKTHAVRGGEIILQTFADKNDPNFLKVAYEVARYHHEKWNGKGYPEGLSKQDIPLHARIMAIADVFDAISAKRVYRDAMPLDTCFEIIQNGAGRDFDPELVNFFMQAREEITDYYKENYKEDQE